ncbi:MAG: HD domain-containing phosphohydrolase [Pseudomonadota bacterium]
MNAAQAHLLFVDDEKPVLNSLKRLLRPTGIRVHIANSGAEGLSLLNEFPIDVVVSDMRMPEMDGAEFLAAVAKKWPDTTRMLLTGYADLTSAVDAINSGSISRYLTKPWQDDDVVMCIKQAVETRQLAAEKARLEVLTAEQNDQLTALNDGLEEKVAERTRQTEAARAELAAAHKDLQASYRATIEVFARIIQLRSGLSSRLSVARDARAVGEKMGLDEAECQVLYEAGLLCDVGKLTLPDATVQTPYTRLDPNAQRDYHRHPVIAEASLLSLEPLTAAAGVIRMHCERVDGSGFPDKIAGSEIPLAARVLAVCKAFADLQDGNVFDERMTAEEAREFLLEQKDKRYDAEVVDRFVAWLGDRRRKPDGLRERKVSLGSVRAGMTTTRDLVDENGALLLAAEQRITDSFLDRLTRLQEALSEPLYVHVRG